LTIAGSSNTYISGIIGSGAGGLAMNGTGLLFLSGSNTYGGATTISSGTVQVPAGGAINNAGFITVSNGGLLISGGLVASSYAQGLWVGDVSTSPASLSISSGTLQISGTTYGLVAGNGNGSTGAPTTINQTGGVITAGNRSYIANFPGGTTTMNVSGGSFTQTSNTFYLGVRGAGALSISGSGYVNVPSIEFGPYSNGSGTLNLNAGGTFATSSIYQGSGAGTFNFNGGTLLASGSSSNFMSGLTAANVQAGGAVVNTNGYNITVGQSLQQGSYPTDGGLTKLGSGTLTLTVPSTYAGPTVINAGRVQLGSGVSGFGGSGTNWTVNNYTISSAPFTANVLTLTDNGGSEGRSAFYNTPVSVNSSFSANFVYQAGGSKQADGIAFMLQDDARGASALGGAGGSFGYAAGTGGTVISPSVAIYLNLYSALNGYTPVSQAGFAADGTLGTAQTTGGLNLGSGDPINVSLNYNAQTSLVTLTLTDTVANTFYTTSEYENLQSALGNSTAYVGFSGADGSLVATQTIGNFSFASSASILPTTTALTIAGGTLDLFGTSQTVANLSGSGAVTNSNAGTASALTTGGDGTSQTYSGIIQDGSGTVALSKVGAGMLTLANSNAYSGGTYVGGGTLQLGNNGAIGTGSLTVNADVLDLAGFNPTVASLAGSSGVITNSSTSAATVTLNPTVPVSTTFSGTLQNGAAAVGLLLNGGTLTLLGNNTHSGPTTINGGALIAAAVNTLSPSSALTVTGGLLDVTAGAQSVPNFSMTGGTLNLDVSNLLNVTAGTANFGGTLNLSDLSGLTPSAGSLELIGYLAYSGSFSASNLSGFPGYQLEYTPSQLDLVKVATGTSVWIAATSGSWNTGSNWSTNPTVPSGVGVVALLGTGATSPTTISLDSPQTLGLLTFASSTAEYTLTPGSNGSLTLDPAPNGNGGGTTGGQIIVLSGTHSIAAPLLISNSAAYVSITSGGSLDISGDITEAGGSHSLSLSSSDSTGVLSLDGTNTFTGGVYVNSGTLILNGASALLPGSALVIGTTMPASLPSVVSSPVVAPSVGLAPVPEPGTLTLLVFCAVAMGTGLWRRKAHKMNVQ
jgi:autotransporter-associated beta strand protein